MFIGCLTFLTFNSYTSISQIVSVTPVQNLSFGAISQGNNGGTVTISTKGSRSATGSVVPLSLGIPYFQAIFEIEAPRGTIISLLHGPDAVLTGSNGGSMSLKIDSTEPGTPFQSDIEPPGKTRLNVGGTLTIGDSTANPVGNYTGTFYITFNNE